MHGVALKPVINKKPHKLMRGLLTAGNTVSDMEGLSVYFKIQPEPLFGSLYVCYPLIIR